MGNRVGKGAGTGWEGRGTKRERRGTQAGNRGDLTRHPLIVGEKGE